VILLKNDCEKGEGVDLAKKYEVRVYPTFAMVDHEGQVTDRWAGYPGVEEFVAIVDAARADRRPIEAKKRAFAEEPTLALAMSLGRYSEAVFASEDAVRYYREAMAMDAQLADELRGKVFMAMFYGLRAGAYDAADLLTEARAIMASDDVSTDQALNVAMVTRRVADPEDYKPILKLALAATRGVEGDEARARRELEVDAALMLDGDPGRALELKRETLPEGWRDDPEQLNRLAWWCFEQDVNLEEAYELAMRGVELASSDMDKANILDTAAEIAFKRGLVDKAIELEQRAIELAPDRGGFQETLKKFEDARDS
jgi:tetratricopeptide (TPR) repeat protein